MGPTRFQRAARSRRHVLRGLTLLLGLAGAHVSEAHELPPAGRLPLIEAGDLVGIDTPWGLVVQDDDAVWRRVCEHAPGADATAYRRLADGRWLVATPGGLFLTDDAGCTYTSFTGEGSDHAIGALAVRDGAIYAVTRSAGRTNGLLSVDPEAATTTPMQPWDDGVLYTGLAVSDDANTLLLSGLDVLGGVPILDASLDGGVTRFDLAGALDLGPSATFRLPGFDGERPILIQVAPSRENVVYELSPGLDEATEVARSDLDLTAHATFAGRRYLTVAGLYLVVQASPGAPLVRVDQAPSRCLKVDGAMLWGCGQERDGVHLFRTADGDTWEPLVRYDEVEERVCPQGSPGRVRCEIYLNPPEADAPTEAPAPGTTAPPETSCGCSTGTAPGWLALALLGLRRRRVATPCQRGWWQARAPLD